ncbi:MAG: translation initiation factor IF-2 N-terminal domain-containing protein, partial [Phycisphaerales bacterium]|nr:translation initiation factor IF-2 N-terminal domain-containing protein [Phycisphaerales bacterium]
MAKTLRIHNIAKELGVDSKDIVAKCQAEDIPDITNHMSTVSVGLAATIREWFSNTGGVATAVEKGPPVDVTRVRAKARKRSRKAETAQSDVEADVVNESEEASADEPVVSIASAPVVELPDTVTPSVVAAPEAPPAAVAIAEAGAGLTVADESAKAEAGSAAPVVQSPPTAPRKAVRAPERQSAAPAAPERPVVMNVPQRPKVVKPVGPILEQPLKTKLSGPKVIRVEAPDVLPTPRARTERARPGEAPGSSRPPSKGGRGAGQHGPLADDGESGRGASRRNKRRAPETDSRRS